MPMKEGQSPLQADWKRTMEGVREQIEVLTPYLPIMRADEINAFGELILTCFLVEKRAQTIDDEIELEKLRAVPRDF